MESALIQRGLLPAAAVSFSGGKGERTELPCVGGCFETRMRLQLFRNAGETPPAVSVPGSTELAGLDWYLRSR